MTLAAWSILSSRPPLPALQAVCREAGLAFCPKKSPLREGALGMVRGLLPLWCPPAQVATAAGGLWGSGFGLSGLLELLPGLLAGSAGCSGALGEAMLGGRGAAVLACAGAGDPFRDLVLPGAAPEAAGLPCCNPWRPAELPSAGADC